MRNKVYSFTPKGTGYTVYATRTDHGKHGRSNSSRSSRSRSNGGIGDLLITSLAYGITRAIFGKRR